MSYRGSYENPFLAAFQGLAHGLFLKQPVQLLPVILVLDLCCLDDFLHGAYKSFDLPVRSCPLWSHLTILETEVVWKCRKLFAVERTL